MYFDRDACVLLQRCRLYIGGVPHRLTEVEFYLQSPSHPDPYVHCTPDQTHTGVWAFHRHKNGSYRGGTYKGLDISFGTPGLFFGILIRGVVRESDGHYVEGPCRTVDYILQLLDFPSIQDFTQGSLLSIRDPRLYLQLLPSPRILEIYRGPRIGLSDKDPRYRDLPYRYATPEVRKEKKSLIPLFFNLPLRRFSSVSES